MTKVSADFIDLGIKRQISIDELKTKAVLFYKFPIKALEGKSRKKPLNIARQMIMYIGYHGTRLSLKEIGAALGERDHTTISNGRNSIQDMIDTEWGFSDKIYEFIEFINMDTIDMEFEHLI